MRKYREYTDDQVVVAAKEVKSIAGLLRKIGLAAHGGNYHTVKKILKKLNIDTSHWTGMAWNRGERLKDWNKYSLPKYFRKHLIKERGHRCENCNLSDWMGGPIPLELHHVDGNRTNHDIKNIQLLCCNCHGLTKNWKNRKLKASLVELQDTNDSKSFAEKREGWSPS